MAGDWIKIEKATARKPEVLAIAEDLEIHPDHSFGMITRFWIWCDDHIRNGHAAGVTKKCLDAVIGVTGFSASLEKVGWADFSNGCLTVPRFESHMSKSAKNRALSTTRKQVERSRNGHASSVTNARPEKRREEVVSSYEDTTAAVADQARALCILHPSRALTQPALNAARAAIKRHGFEAVRAGTVAYTAAVNGWTPAERLQFVTNPERFFSEDTWNQPAENWNSRTAARRENTPERQTVNVGGRKPKLNFDHLPKELQPKA